MSDLPPVEALENVVQAALEQRDFVGVGHALKLIAVQDPKRAEILLDTIKVGLAINRERQGASDGPR
jgi:hypothetical protein